MSIQSSGWIAYSHITFNQFSTYIPSCFSFCTQIIKMSPLMYFKQSTYNHKISSSSTIRKKIKCCPANYDFYRIVIYKNILSLTNRRVGVGYHEVTLLQVQTCCVISQLKSRPPQVTLHHGQIIHQTVLLPVLTNLVSQDAQCTTLEKNLEQTPTSKERRKLNNRLDPSEYKIHKDRVFCLFN